MTANRRAVAWALAIAVVAPARAADATPAAKLTYIRGPDCEQCPDEAQLRRAIALRLGYDPFFPWAKQTVIAELERASTGYAGRVRIVDDHGVIRGERRLTQTGSDCAETINALALAISIGIDDMPPDPVDPESAPPPAAATTPMLAPARVLEPVPEPTPSSAPVRSKAANAGGPGLTPFLGARIHGAIGAAPSATPGATLAFGVRRAALSGALEGRADLAASTTTTLGTVSSSTYLLTLVPCIHFGTPFVCGVFGGGGFIYAGGKDLAESKQGTLFMAVSGARVGAELPLSGAVDAFVAADLVANVTRHRVRIDDVEVYRQSALSVAGGIGMKLHFR